MSKATVVTLPFVLLLLDYWPLKRITNYELRIANLRPLLLEKIPFFALAIGASIADWAAEANSGAWQGMVQQAASDHYGNALISYVRYLGKLFWPENLCIYYPYSGPWPLLEVMGAGLLLAGISVLVLVQRRRRPYLVVGWFWYVGTLAPTVLLIERALQTQDGSQAIADHYTYIPLLGVYWLVVWGLEEAAERWRRGAMILSVAGAAALVACGALTRYEIGFWKDDVTVWTRAITVTKNNYVAHDNLGNCLLETNPSQALAEFQEAANINPNYPPAQMDLAVVLARNGQLDDGYVHFKRYLQLNPNDELNRSPLVKVLLTKGKAGEAIFKDVIAIRLRFNAGSYPAYNNLAWLLATTPDSDIRDGPRAVQLAQHACELTDYKQTICVGTLAAAYAEAGRFDDAIVTAQKACDLAAQHGEADLLRKNQELLKLYRSHQPYHETAK